MKVRIDTKLSFEDGVKNHSVIGILADNQLKYKEDDTLVIVDFINGKMLREDDDKKIEYKFIKNSETLNDLVIKKSNYHIKIPILTKVFEFSDSSCFIEYQLVLEEKTVNYKISWEATQ